MFVCLLCVLFSFKFSQKVDIEFTDYKKDIESISLLVLQVTVRQSYHLINGKGNAKQNDMIWMDIMDNLTHTKCCYCNMEK